MNDSLTSVGQRIKQRRIELNLTQSYIQMKTGISSGNLSEIENGNRTPSMATLYRLSDILACSIDWIVKGAYEPEHVMSDDMAETDINNLITEKGFDMEAVGARIKKYRKLLGLSQTDVYEKCGITSGALSRIEHGKTVPSILIFYNLSEILNCDMKWLLTGIAPHYEGNHLTEPEKNMITDMHKLPAEEQKELYDILQLKLRKVEKQQD